MLLSLIVFLRAGVGILGVKFSRGEGAFAVFWKPWVEIKTCTGRYCNQRPERSGPSSLY